ncbi:hypothetical protein QGN29_02380 [Temperatibacter marinus]|uniref:Uncharacterized protein n=1 Tax=Temperatibacter marinus TaxID=1456591 RepID=A0AA52EIN6_9PROT|nr:hypothetical protein [Temperatibacter marinus]WND03214.1 hypothetical protein QGN29_02380 [Temperatibacter marinus]
MTVDFSFLGKTFENWISQRPDTKLQSDHLIASSYFIDLIRHKKKRTHFHKFIRKNLKSTHSNFWKKFLEALFSEPAVSSLVLLELIFLLTENKQLEGSLDTYLSLLGRRCEKFSADTEANDIFHWLYTVNREYPNKARSFYALINKLLSPLKDIIHPKNPSRKHFVIAVNHIPCLPESILRNSHLFVVYAFIEVLIEAYEGCRILLVFTGENQRNSEFLQHPNYKNPSLEDSRKYYGNSSSHFWEYLPKKCKESVEVFIPSSQTGTYNLYNSYQQIIEKIEAFNPCAIFTAGGVMEAKYIAQLYYKKRPTIFVPFNQNNQLFAPYKGYLNYFKKEKLAIDPIASDRKLFSHTKAVFIDPPEPILPKLGRYKKTDFVEGEKAFLLVTALTNNRTSKALKAHFKEKDLEQFAAIFDQHPNLHWLIFGEEEASAITELHPKLHQLQKDKRLIIRESESNLRGAYEHCKIYFNPFGAHGGGNGARMAALEKCAVITYSSSDLDIFTPQELIAPSLQNQLEILLSLIQSEEKLADFQERCFHKTANRNPKKFKENLNTLLF